MVERAKRKFNAGEFLEHNALPIALIAGAVVVRREMRKDQGIQGSTSRVASALRNKLEIAARSRPVLDNTLDIVNSVGGVGRDMKLVLRERGDEIRDSAKKIRIHISNRRHSNF